MWPYWMMFVVPATAALVRPHGTARAGAGLRATLLDGTWIAVIVAMTLLIGFRIEVGGDWLNYFHYLDAVAGARVDDVLSMSDPGYQLINWLSAEMGWGIFGVNVIGGALFSVGLAAFCRSLPRPWLALAVAVPYLVIVVAMGYSRQGIALGLAMLGLAALGRAQAGWFAFWVIVAATFHKSAVLLLPIAALTATRNRYWTAAWIAVATFLGYHLLLEDSVEIWHQNYVEAQYQSQGAFIRLTMNGLPAVVLLLLRRRFRLEESDRRLWLWFSAISLGLLGVLLATPATTAVDRVALYLLPLQLVVFAHLPDVLEHTRGRNAVVAGVLLYYAAVLFVWLNFASHAFAWLPYRFFPTESWF